MREIIDARILGHIGMLHLRGRIKECVLQL